jgi:uncharacterized protein (DUF1800 family)
MTCTLLFLVLAVSLGVEPPVVGSAGDPAGGLKPLAESAWDYAKARHLLFRAGFGGTPQEVEKLHAMGLRRAVDYLVDYGSLPAADLAAPGRPQEPPLDPIALMKLTAEERQKRTQQRRREDMQQLAQARAWWLRRMIETPRPLEEKLVLFWHGHFATEHQTVRDAQAMIDQNELFRRHAAGNFGKLLHGIVHDPAMLRYLDNNRNVRGKPNENLAREIMELFSLGEGNYTEQDIKEAARALTGYTFQRFGGEFQFAAGAHDPGSKTIFGRTGNWDGDQLVELILDQPAAARFIARKLFIYFVHEAPSDQMVATLADVMWNHEYGLTPVLKAMFLSEEFYSPKAMGTQIKSPVHLVVSTVRTLGAERVNPGALAMATRGMGQELFDPPNVKGWDGGEAWINTNTLFARNNTAALLVSRGNGPVAGEAVRKIAAQAGRGDGRLPGPLAPELDLVALLEHSKPETPAAVVDQLARTLFAVPLNPTKRAELIQFVGSIPPSTQWASQRTAINRKLGALLVVMMSMPEFQLT